MELSEAHRHCDAVLDAVSQAVITDPETLRIVLTGALAGGHVLLEDAPGTGKTLTARSFSTALGLSFSRIQFTPDLLPADVTGTDVYDESTGEFEFTPGPLFANVVLADEINRASPKTQSALLEAMEERQVTVDGRTHPLPSPFFVIATQNPTDDGQGTFPLPDAQKDRFLVQSSLGYPSEEGELELLERRVARDRRHPSTDRQLGVDTFAQMQAVTETVSVDRDVLSYIVTIVRRTRSDERTSVGVSPRGTQRLLEVARARAVLDGRPFTTPDDVKSLARPALAHRLVLTADARVSSTTPEEVVDDVLAETPVPTVSRVARQ
ncbi:MAG: AAA family ATPase [Halobacteriota archaeon]